MTEKPTKTKATEAHARTTPGFALLIVLWALVPLALMFADLAAAARADAQSTADLRAAAILEAAADGAIDSALFDLLANRHPTPPQLPGVTLKVDVASLTGFLNPNTASPELLQAFMIRLGANPSSAGFIANAILDWRTPGQKARPGGAKAPEYRTAGLDYGPPGTPFESVDELGLVLGMTPDLLQALAPHLSLSAYGIPDPASAGPLLRAALRDVGIIRNAAPLATRVVQVTATATATNTAAAHAVRRAIIQIGPAPNGRHWRVLTRDAVPDK